MNPTLHKPLMHLKTNRIVVLMLLLVFALAMPLSPAAVLAQDESPTPAPSLPADAAVETPGDPTAEPMDESAAPTEMPAEAEPTPTEAPVIPDVAPDEMQASAPDWRVEYDLAYTPLQVAYEGGRESLETRLNTYFTDALSPLGATHQLTPADSAGGAAAYLLTLSGSGGAAQLRQVLQNALSDEFYFLGGIASLEISGEAHSGATWQLKLDSNITTPFKWQVESSERVVETIPSDYQHVSNLKGAPGHQVFSLRNTDGGSAALRLKYAPAWDAARPADRRMYLSAPLNQDIDLSTLIASGDAREEPPPLSEELADDPDRVWAQGTLPAYFDWREHGGVPDEVRYQGTCGSCWAFATVGVMESAMLINGAPADLDLSEQFLVSCTLNHNKGCKGGYSDSHKYHVSTLAQQQTAAGAVLEADMPYANTYTKVEAPCQTVNHPYRLAKWYRITSDWTTIPSVETIKRTIYTKGPITVTVCAGDEFHDYSYLSGVFTTNEASSCGSSKINHAVILVGWGTDPTDGTYWILRNSWSSMWGDNGYMYIKAGTSNVGMDATYVEYLPLPDRIAPMVKKIDTSSHTSDKKIIQDEQVSVPVTKIYAVFDEAMYSASGVSDITTPANYSLVNLGADNTYGTGDDAAVTINSVTYTASSYTATLNVNGGAALPNASYLLTISGSANVKDKGGNLLDGNGDGIAGGDYAMAFTISIKPPAPLLTAPASSGYTNDQTPQFTWNAANFATKYKFQLDDTSNFSSLLIDENVGSATTYTSALTLPAGKYYWRVFGINRYDAEGAKSSRYFTIDITPPPAPVLKSPADAASYKGTPTYTWGTATGAKYYQFRWYGESSTSYTSPVLTAAKHKPPTQPLGTYTWQVRAGDLAGNWSDWSSTRSLTVIPPIPAAPVLAAPANGLNIIDRSPELDWNDVDYAIRYEIQVASSSKFSPLLQSSNELATSMFTPADLADGKYYWRVRAFNVNNEPGKWCSPRSFVVDNVAPLAPVLAAPADGITAKGTPTYSWKAAAGAKYYQFRYLTTPENELIYTSSESTSTKHKPPTQAPGAYVWQVRARDLAGNWGAWSATRAITIIPTVPAAPKLTSPASGSSTSNTTPDLSWNAVAYGHTYEIQIDNSSKFGSPDYSDTGIGGATYTAGPLAAGKWYWRVRAVNTLGQAGKWSSARSLTITP